MPRSTYTIKAQLDPAELLPAAKDVVQELNGWMKGFGFDEKLCLRSTIDIAELSIEGELTEDSKREFTNIMESEFAKQLPNWKVRIVDFVKL